MLISPAYAQAAGGGDLISAFLPLILIFVIFYFLLIRPQQKKQKQHRDKVQSVKVGDHIIIGGGVYGKVTGLPNNNDSDAEVEIANGVTVRILKTTIIDVLEANAIPKATSTKSASTRAKSVRGTTRGTKKEAPTKKTTRRTKKPDTPTDEA